MDRMLTSLAGALVAGFVANEVFKAIFPEPAVDLRDVEAGVRADEAWAEAEFGPDPHGLWDDEDGPEAVW